MFLQMVRLPSFLWLNSILKHIHTHTPRTKPGLWKQAALTELLLRSTQSVFTGHLLSSRHKIWTPRKHASHFPHVKINLMRARLAVSKICKQYLIHRRPSQYKLNAKIIHQMLLLRLNKIIYVQHLKKQITNALKCQFITFLTSPKKEPNKFDKHSCHLFHFPY